MDILAIYERGLGKKINRDKTNFFSALILLICILVFKEFWGVSAIRQYEKYLGLPALVGRAKKQSFIYIKERVWEKL